MTVPQVVALVADLSTPSLPLVVIAALIVAPDHLAEIAATFVAAYERERVRLSRARERRIAAES